MKIVIENFSTSDDTQALYLTNTLKEMGHDAIIFDQTKNSIYDTLDTHVPDIYISHAFRLSQDLLFYLENNNKNIDILLNINGLKTGDISNFDKFFQEKGIESSFFFTSMSKQIIPKTYNNIVILHNAADLNLLQRQPNIEYHIEKAIFVYNKESIKEYDGSYHIITTNPNLKDVVDIYLPEMSLASLYQFYDEIIFRDFLGYLPQAFFDAIVMGPKVYFDVDDKDIQDSIDTLASKILKIDTSINYKSDNKLNNFTQLKEYVLEKHTNKNRTNTLLSNIKKRVSI
jgi:hypothetical protein